MRVSFFLLFALPATAAMFYTLSNVVGHLQGAIRLLPALGFAIFCGIVCFIVQVLYEHDVCAHWINEGLKYDMLSKKKLMELYKTEGLEALIRIVEHWQKLK